MTLEAGGLGPGRHIPEPDRVVRSARGEPPVRQQAKGGDRGGMTLEAGGLGPGTGEIWPEGNHRRFWRKASGLFDEIE